MNLKEILWENNIPYKEAGEHHHVTEGFLGIECPFCSKDSGKFKLGYSLSYGYFTCWTCGHHRPVEVLVEITGKSPRECFEMLSQLECQVTKKKVVKGKTTLPSGTGSLLPIHKNYLRKRGFDPKEIVKLWGVMGTGLASYLAWKLVIPIHFRGQIVSWTTRSVSDEGSPRYINAQPEHEALPIKSLLYGEDFCRHATVVVEGPVDTWRIGPGSVAVLGTAVSAAQVAKLVKYPVRVVCMDVEPSAQVRARELCEKLESFPGTTTNIVLESGKDPGEASASEIACIRRRFLE